MQRIVQWKGVFEMIHILMVKDFFSLLLNIFTNQLEVYLHEATQFPVAMSLSEQQNPNKVV